VSNRALAPRLLSIAQVLDEFRAPGYELVCFPLHMCVHVMLMVANTASSYNVRPGDGLKVLSGNIRLSVHYNACVSVWILSN
jgi:hypothetical protein